MAEMVLFHHAQGQTAGFLEFAADVRRAGHVVHTPDLYDGHTFDDLDDGLAYAREVGFDALLDAGVRAGEELPAEVVYGGFSLGVLPAQKLAQTRPGARGALLLHGCLPVSEFGNSWPDDVAVQIHAMQDDPFFEEDLPAARALVEAAPHAELFLYPGDQHLFADSSLPAFTPGPAAMLTGRVCEFLAAH